MLFWCTCLTQLCTAARYINTITEPIIIKLLFSALCNHGKHRMQVTEKLSQKLVINFVDI